MIREFILVIVMALVAVSLNLAAAAPARAQMEFNRDGNTGSIDQKSGDITFDINGAEKARIDSTGRLSVSAGAQVGADPNCASAVDAGTIRYVSSELQFCDGTVWRNLGAPDGGTGCSPGAAVGDSICGGQIAGLDGILYDLIVTQAGCASGASSAAQCSGTDGVGQQFIWGDATAVGPVPVLQAWESVATLPGAGGPGPVTNLDVNKPTGTVAGDLLVMIVAVDATNPNVTMPAGFTELVDQNFVHLAVGYKLAGASEPATYNVSWGISEDALIYLLRFSGVDPDDPIVLGADGCTSNNTQVLFTQLTTSKDNSYVLGTASINGGSGFEGGSGWASFTAIDLLDNSFANQAFIGFDTFATSGSTADDTFTGGGGTFNCESYLIEIKAISTPPAVATTDFVEGAENQAEIIAHGDANGYQTPAADYCDGLTIDSANWHLPAAHELETVQINFASAGSWTNADFITLSSAYYWQSSERGDLEAWSSQVYSGDVLRSPVGLDDKTDTHYVRCVRREAAQ